MEHIQSSLHKKSHLSEKFINFLLMDGKKVKASTLYFHMLQLVKQKFQGSPISKSSLFQGTETRSAVHIVEQALRNCMPSLEVRKVRVAGTTYLVPTMLQKKKQETLALNWILEAAQKKKKSTKLSFAQCLADEIFEAFHKQGYARTKRNDLHRLAEANRAYIRYRWW